MMSRRALLALLAVRARGASLEPYFESRQGAAVLLDVRSQRTIGVYSEAVASRYLAPPGSTLKPFVLSALLRSGKLVTGESLPCPGNLTIAGRSFACSHPRLAAPMHIDTALTYSCNYFVARVAERLAPGELARDTLLMNVGRLRPASGRDGIRLQALGEENILVTAADLAAAYRRLALQAAPLIIKGLEGAVEYGTAQRAQVKGEQVAGKTGSAMAESGAPIAWFAGFMPSQAPRVAVAVMLQGHSGGSDAAPIAGRILAAYKAGRL